MTPDEIKVRGRRITEELLNQGDVAVVDELFDPHYTQYLVPEDRTTTVEELVAATTEMRRSVPDVHAHIEHQAFEGDTLVQLLTLTGTPNGGAFSGLAGGSDRPLRITLLEIYRVGPDGRFTRGWTSWHATRCPRADAPGRSGRTERRPQARGLFDQDA